MRVRLAFELGRRRSLDRPGDVPVVKTAAMAAELLDPVLRDAPVEVFAVMLLDGRHRVQAIQEVSRGTLTSSLVHPREVFRPALLAGSASILVAHNHPSGDPEPSPEDDAVTHRIVSAGEILGIPVLDHLIIADGYTSFRERGHRAFVKGVLVGGGKIGERGAYMMSAQWCAVETKMGPMGLVWRGERLLRVLLPDGTREGLDARRAREFPDAQEAEPMGPFEDLRHSLIRYFEGAPVDPASLPVNFELEGVSSFMQRVYSELRLIPRGEVVSYGALASRAGSSGAARAVGNAMAGNPFPILIPCHRVLRQGRQIGSFGGPVGPAQKEMLLRLEGAWPLVAAPHAEAGS
jgi:DNA repair protein RadC